MFAASSPFADAADAQSAALGFSPARVLVAHPIQDRTDEEMCDLARGALGALRAALVGQRLA